MKRFFNIIVLMLATASFVSAQDIVGKWKLEDGSAIVEVYKKGDAYNGRIVWLETPTYSNGTPVLDTNNPDKSLQSRKLINLDMLSGLKPNGKEYTGGTIYDPNNGKTYFCSMKVEKDVLKVCGSLDKRGILGRTMDWFRVK